jgi:hypothetical protein
MPARKKHLKSVRCRSITVRSLAHFVEIIHELQEEWSEWEDEGNQGSADGRMPVQERGVDPEELTGPAAAGATAESHSTTGS